MNDETFPVSIIFRRTQPGPTRCSWPTYWSRVFGLTLSGRGIDILFNIIVIVLIYLFPYMAS